MKIASLFFVFLSIHNHALADITNFAGDWSGQCKHHNYADSFDIPDHNMQLIVRPTKLVNTYGWIIKYDFQPDRNYQVFMSNTGLDGHYVLDENNGILIDLFLLDKNLHYLFTVNGRLFNNEMQLDNQKITYKITTYSTTPRVTMLQSSTTQVMSFGLLSRTICELQKI